MRWYIVCVICLLTSCKDKKQAVDIETLKEVVSFQAIKMATTDSVVSILQRIVSDSLIVIDTSSVKFELRKLMEFSKAIRELQKRQDSLANSGVYLDSADFKLVNRTVRLRNTKGNDTLIHDPNN